MKTLVPTCLCLALVFSIPNHSIAQKVSADTFEVYRVNPWISTSIVIGGAAAVNFGRQRNNDKDPLSLSEITEAQSVRLNVLDRIALRQDPSRRDHFEMVSNRWLIGTAAVLPGLLFLDREIRRDWLGILALYLETQSVSNTLHTWAPFGPAFINRFRPQVYYEEIPVEFRSAGTSRNSFYGGHTANAACATFFIAKVLTDYHPEWGSRKWIAYGLALVPPVVIAMQRVQALRHFPSDNLVGLVVGAATGVLVPELHKIRKAKKAVKADF